MTRSIRLPGRQGRLTFLDRVEARSTTEFQKPGAIGREINCRLYGVLGVLRDGRQHAVQTGGALRNRAAIF
jgi:hypothetical protein